MKKHHDIVHSDSNREEDVLLNKTDVFRILLDAELKTGRTHQIRVHLAHLGFPILGDDKYGDFDCNRQLAKRSEQAHLSRMFLHAHTLLITHPITHTRMTLQSPLPKDLQQFIDNLTRISNQ